MRKNIARTIGKISLVLALAAGFATTGTAQDYVNTPVEISKDKVRVNGQICYSHVVLERQTLYSISKAYNVSVEDIYSYNPDLKETGLKKNSIIVIPLVEAAKEVIKEEAKTKEPEKPVTKEKKSNKKQTVHVSKWYEDLNTIAEKYGVTPEAIMKENNLTSTTLSNRQKLIIPEKSVIESTKQNIIVADTKVEDAEPVKEDIAVQVTEPTEEVSVYAEAAGDAIPSWNTYAPKDKVKATMLLPFKTADGRINRNNMDFYSGALIAAYDMAEKGVNIDFTMFDIMDDTHPVTREEIEGSDMIIGPVSGNDISRLLESFQSGTMVISPLDPKVESLVISNANLIQAPTPHKAQYIDITEWIKEDLTPADTVIVISENAFRQSEAAKTMMEVIDSSGIVYNAFSYNILEGRDVVEPLKLIMTQYGTNRVMIASENEAFVNDVVRNMNLMLYEQYKVVIYAPSKIRSFDTIEVEHFHKTNMHVSLTYYIDYEDPRVREFLLKYRALYNTEPSQFAFQGYDIASYFINLCSRYGDRWAEMIDKAPQAMLQSTFRCRKDSEEGGFVNNGIRRIIYGDNWAVYEAE